MILNLLLICRCASIWLYIRQKEGSFHVLSGLNLWTLVQYQFIIALIISNGNFRLKLLPEQATRELRGIIPCALTGPWFGILLNAQRKSRLLFHFFSPQFIMGVILMYVCMCTGLGAGIELIILSRPAASSPNIFVPYRPVFLPWATYRQSKHQTWSVLWETLVAMKWPQQFPPELFSGQMTICCWFECALEGRLQRIRPFYPVQRS